MNPVYIPIGGRKKVKAGNFVEAKRIIEIVVEYFGISNEDLVGKCRRADRLYPRQVCTWLLVKYSAHSESGVAVILGQKHWKSANNSIKAIENYLSYDDSVIKQIELLKNKILGTNGNT